MKFTEYIKQHEEDKKLKNQPKIQLVLTYDESLKEYDGIDFREVIVEFFLENGIEELKSYNKSTIHFKSPEARSVEYWYGKLLREYDKDHFYFTINLVAEYEAGKQAFAYKMNPDENLEKQFDIIVAQVKENLKKGK